MTETTTTPQRAGEDPLLFKEEVAALVAELGGKPINPQTVNFYASQSRRRNRRGELTAYDIPIPRDEDYGYRADVPNVRAARWRRSQIVAWQRARTSRPAPQRDRDKATGQYTPKAS